MDYWDLAKFYADRDETEKALETAEEGLLKGKGMVIELLEYLAEQYAEKRDTSRLERIVDTALDSHQAEKTCWTGCLNTISQRETTKKQR